MESKALERSRKIPKAYCLQSSIFKISYRRILKISWKDRVTNEEVLDRMQVKLHFMEDMIKRKNEICRTFAERLEWFITSTGTRGYVGGKNENGCSKKT